MNYKNKSLIKGTYGPASQTGQSRPTCPIPSFEQHLSGFSAGNCDIHAGRRCLYGNA